jgi:DNA replication protein DnaC
MNLEKQMERIGQAIKQRQLQTAPVSYDALRETAVRETQAKLKQERMDSLIHALPALYQGKTFADIKIDYTEQVKVKNIVMRYAETFDERKKSGSNLIFSGASGTGRTLFSLVLYQTLAKAGYQVRYESSLIFLRTLRDKNFEGNAAFRQLMDVYQQIDFLVIDEVTEGLVKGGTLCAWETEMLFTLVNMRYQQKLCTLVITNCDNDRFKLRLGERITGRLLEKGIFLAFNWPSYR